VDDLIGIDNSTSRDKKVGRIKKKVRELKVIEKFIKNEKPSIEGL
jgi:hypothetical protein